MENYRNTFKTQDLLAMELREKEREAERMEKFPSVHAIIMKETFRAKRLT